MPAHPPGLSWAPASFIYCTMLRRACGAQAIERHGVLSDSKLRRRQLAEIIQAPDNVKSTIALFALKMMMVAFARALVPSGFSRYFHGFNPTVGHERRDRAVDSRYAETLGSPRRCLEQIIDAQGTFGAFQNGAHGIPLLCFPANANHACYPPPEHTLRFRALSGRPRPAPAARLTI